MLKGETKNKYLDICLIAFAALSVLNIVFLILAFTPQAFHSDCAAFLYQAMEQAAQHKLIPDRFHYTTEIFAISPSLFIVPFVNIIKNQLLLREIGSIGAYLFFVATIWLLFWKEKRIAAVVTILVSIPHNGVYTDIMFIQADRIITCCELFLHLFFVHKIINGKENKVWLLLVYAAFIVFSNFSVVTNYIFIMCPIILSLLLKEWIEHGLEFKEWTKDKNVIAVLITIAVSCLISFVIFKSISTRLEFNINTKTSGIVDPEAFHDTFWVTFVELLQLFGIDSTESIFSLTTIQKILCIVYMITCIIIAPIIVIKNRKMYGDKWYSILLPCILLSPILLFFMFVCDLTNSRYYIPALVANAVVIAFAIEVLVKKHYKHFKYALWALVVVFALMQHLAAYDRLDYSRIEKQGLFEAITNPKVESDLNKFLLGHDLTYGFTTFWESYNNAVFSNGDITYAAHAVSRPLMPFFFERDQGEKTEYYACSEDLYNPNIHAGKCFLAVKNGEEMPQVFFDKAEEILECDGYKILVYNDNIYGEKEKFAY